MNMKKLLSLMLALLMMLSAAALAEAGAVEEVPEHNYEVITDPVIITYGDQEIHVSEAMTRFMDYYQTLAGYESYGIDASSFLTKIKQSVLAEMVQDIIEAEKVKELGYDQFTAEEQAEIDEQVESTFNEVYLYYYDYVSYNSSPETDVAAEVTKYLEHYNYTREDIQAMISNSYAANKMATDLTKDVVVTDEAMQEFYNAAVAEDEDAYAQDLKAYEKARTADTDTICWNPEGYRRVLQVLIGFEADAKTEYNALLTQKNTLLGLNGETAEQPELTLEEIEKRMDELEAPLMATANEVTAKFNNGATIEELMAEYNDDPSTPAEGYYVHIASEIWDPAFVDAAYSVNEIGQLSAPYAGQHGLYMVYYLADVPAGPVALDEVRAILEPTCLSELQRSAYFAMLDTWQAEMGITTNIDMFITGYEK